MADEWVVECKDCKKKFGYSDRSFRYSLQYGFSRPEYCDDCQKDEKVMRRGIGAPYFHVPHIEGMLVPGPLGFIEREVRLHTPVEKEGKFDESTYGITTDKIREIAEWLDDPEHRVVVVVGPTGSGKSTALPYWLLYPPDGVEEDFFTRDGQILVSQPRIIAVTKLSEYIGAELLGSSVGAGYDVGFRYSKEDRADWRNAIELTTDGKLINSIVAGRISQYGVIMIDEAHERSENIETILRLLRDRMGLYPNLKSIISSATINAELFRQYFDKEGAKIIEFEGKAKLDDKGNPIKYDVYFAAEKESLPYEEINKILKPILRTTQKKVQELVKAIVSGKKDWGDILVFLPSKKPINTLVERLNAWVNQNEELATVVELCPLYRGIDEEAKEAALTKNISTDKVRIIVSTNIAEASVTVHGVVYEIETGVEYQPWYRKEIGATEVPLVLISRANAKQRWGRTGRTKSGEVYCLYTEGQFEDDNLFLEYPIPAMQRVSLENAVLTAKVSGISEVSKGWLEDPPNEEIERSTQELVNAGALDEEGSLTKYGEMIRWFSYPIRLVNVLLAAEDIGCSVELATLLPVIKNGGRRRLLKWDYGWDAYTKRQAYKRHHALMAGCQDDVEFILKVYKAWEELPWLREKDVSKLKKEEVEALRKQWCKLHFVSHQVMKVIREEREKTLKSLGVGKKSDEVRMINLSQINRVRGLLLATLEDTECLVPEEQYVYSSEVSPEIGSSITCSVLRTKQESYNPESWLFSDAKWLWEKEVGVYSRLFVEQVYPVGFRFEATVEEQEDGYSWIRTRRNLTRAEALDIARGVDVFEDDYDIEEDIGDGFQDEEREEVPEKEEPEISLFDMSIRYYSVACSQKVLSTEVEVGEEIVVEITGYEFPEDSNPVVVAEVVSQPEPFEVFAKSHRYGDEVTVKAIGILQFPNDYSAALIAMEVETEVETGLEVLLEPHDMSFTRNSHAVTEIPVGTVLRLNVEHIDIKRRRVRLTNWEYVEEELTSLFFSSVGNGHKSRVVAASVIDVHDTGKVVFTLDESRPEVGLNFITSAFGDKLDKTYLDYNIGEQVSMRLFRRDKAHVSLGKLPVRAKSLLGQGDEEGELSWKRGTLSFSGRMTYEKLYELKANVEDLEFHRALESLYWFSNSVFVDKFLDVQWQETVSKEYPVGTVVTGTVQEVNTSGVVVEVEPGVNGFLPASKILGGVGNPTELLLEGHEIGVSVVEQRKTQQELLLEITKEGAEDPLEDVEVGTIYSGVIIDVAKFGVFVNIAPLVKGIVHFSNMYRSRYAMSDIFSEGGEVFVRVVSIDHETRQVNLDMRIPGQDPIRKLSVGQEVRGKVVNVKDFGAFVELNPYLDGLLGKSEFPVLQEIEVGLELLVEIASINEAKREISLKYVRKVE